MAQKMAIIVQEQMLLHYVITIHIMIINQAIRVRCLVNHLLCHRQCHLIGVQISEVSKFVADSPSEATYAIYLVHPLNFAHLHIILSQSLGVASYFDVYSPSTVDHEN